MKKKLLQGLVVCNLLLFGVVLTQDAQDLEINGIATENTNPEVEVNVVKNDLPKVRASLESTPLQEVAINNIGVVTENVEGYIERDIPVGSLSAVNLTVNEMELESVPTFKVEETTKTMYATASVNVRDYADTDGNKLGSYTKNKEVKVTGICDNGWVRVDYSGTEAYVNAKYLTDTKPVTQSTSSNKAPENMNGLIRLNSTAYYNPSGNKTADGSDTIAGFTLAGKRSWLGRGCYLYKCNKDGSVGEYMGYYEFHDTGYGKDGDIVRGETIDIYMETRSECYTWGRRDVYVQFVD